MAAAENDPGYLWWEGENPIATNVPNRSPFAPGTGGDFSVLSGGQWISGVVKAGDEPYAAAYRLDIPHAGQYTLWARKFWKHGPFDWRFGKQPWQTVGREIGLLDNATIRHHLGVNWVAVGRATLDAGDTVFAWRMTDLQPGKDEAVGFDAFLLVRDDGPHAGFVPAATRRPGQRDAPAEPGSFAWDPPANAYPDDLQQLGFNLRRLNEPYAGVHGRVTTARDGQAFVLGESAKPVRFFGVNVKPTLGDAPDLTLHHWARKLAKFGVNLVRVHGPLWTQQQGQWRIDPRQLDNVHRIVHACKQQGIYVKISWYFPVWIDAPHAKLPGYENTQLKNPFAAVFFSEGVQDWYFQSLRDIVTPANPYTGLSLADDPAVALIELINEDSLFFWTFKKDNLPAPLWADLENRYRASPHYAGGPLRDIWHLTRDALEKGSDSDRAQAKAQAAFLAETQRAFYERGVAELRKLKYDGLVICSNWHTADAPLLDALERWTYTAGDVTDHHGYFEGEHRGTASAWAVRNGDRFQNRSALDDPAGTPLRVNQAVGHPAMISEIGWPHPNAHQPEMTLLGALAMGVQGIDAVTWFVNDTPTLNQPDLTPKFAIDSPAVFGTFPAAALLYRGPFIAEQPPVLLEPLASASLKQLAGSKSASAAALDALRAGDVPDDAPTAWSIPLRVDARAAFLGPVLRAFDQPDAIEQWRDPADAIANNGHDLHASDDRAQWSLRAGRSLVWAEHDNPHGAPTAYAAIAKAAGLDDLQPHIRDTTADFLSFAAVPLDGARSRVLLQLITPARPRGFVEVAGQITAIGTRPWQLRQHHTTVQIPFPQGTNVHLTALDENGNRTPRPLETTADGSAFTWPDATLYVLAERR